MLPGWASPAACGMRARGSSSGGGLGGSRAKWSCSCQAAEHLRWPLAQRQMRKAVSTLSRHHNTWKHLSLGPSWLGGRADKDAKLAVHVLQEDCVWEAREQGLYVRAPVVADEHPTVLVTKEARASCLLTGLEPAGPTTAVSAAWRRERDRTTECLSGCNLHEWTKALHVKSPSDFGQRPDSPEAELHARHLNEIDG